MEKKQRGHSVPITVAKLTQYKLQSVPVTSNEPQQDCSREKKELNQMQGGVAHSLDRNR